MWFPLVADGIASGCLMAAAVMAWRSRPSFERLLQSRGVAMAPLAILLLDAARWRGRIFLPFGELLMTLAIALSIARFAVYPKSAFASLLNSRWMMAIGTLSYSLYLWQQLFLDPYSNRLWTTFPANVAFAFAAASASYFLVERPLLNLRRRFHPVAPGVASFQHEVQPASLDLHSTAVVP
jgi:peptidoglycan/LPS O-acetylase OafA/YrhL